MFDLTDLNLRYRAHYERTERAGAVNQLSTFELSPLKNPRRRLAALLLALASRLAPEVAGRVADPRHKLTA